MTIIITLSEGFGFFFILTLLAFISDELSVLGNFFSKTFSFIQILIEIILILVLISLILTILSKILSKKPKFINYFFATIYLLTVGYIFLGSTSLSWDDPFRQYEPIYIVNSSKIETISKVYYKPADSEIDNWEELETPKTFLSLFPDKIINIIPIKFRIKLLSKGYLNIDVVSQKSQKVFKIKPGKYTFKIETYKGTFSDKEYYYVYSGAEELNIEKSKGIIRKKYKYSNILCYGGVNLYVSDTIMKKKYDKKLHRYYYDDIENIRNVRSKKEQIKKES